MKTTKATTRAYTGDFAIPANAAATSTWSPDDRGPAAAHLVITKVVREHHPLPRAALGENGVTIGKMIDDMLADVAADGGEVQSLQLDVTEEYWKDIAEAVRKGIR